MSNLFEKIIGIFSGEKKTPFFLCLPIILLMLFTYLFPLLYMVAVSFAEKEGFGGYRFAFSTENYIKFLSDPWYLGVLLRTIYISFISTVITIVMAYTMAYYLVFFNSKIKELCLVLVISPILVGNIIRAFGWRVLLSGKGVINSFLMAAGFIDTPIAFMNTELGVIIAMSSVLLPMAVMVLLGGLSNLKISYIEAAKSLGGNKIKTLLTVSLPLSLPSIYAASIISFVTAVGAFEIPLFIGGKKVPVMGPVIYEQFSVVFNWPFGSAATAIILSVAMILAGASNFIFNKNYE